MTLTLAYITHRREPRWEWFVDSLCAQLFHPTLLGLDKRPLCRVAPREDVQAIFVDGKLWPDVPIVRTGNSLSLADPFYHDPKRRAALEAIVAGRFDFLHLPPKPCVRQGPFRLTCMDWFCAANTRNTAIIAAKHDYLVCVDDLSVLMPKWLDQVMHAARHGYCVCGAYKKVLNLEIGKDLFNGGVAVQYTPFLPGVDSRWDKGSDSGIVPWHGTGLYGCSFGLPTEAALAVDGFDPACNGEGMEDFEFGIRLERSGARLHYNRNMLTLESEEAHHTEASLPRERKLVSRDRLPNGYDSYQMPNEAEKYFSDHVLLNRVCNETSRILPLFPDGLRTIRQEFLATGMVPIPKGPTTDWRDGTKLSEL